MLRKYNEIIRRIWGIDPDLVGFHRAQALEQRVKDIFMLIVSLILFFIWLSFSSCHSEQRIARKALAAMDKAETKYNDRSGIDTAGAHYCNTKHPVKVGKGQVRYIKGDTVTRTDTITSVLTSVDHDTVKVLRTITKVLYVHDTTVQTDTFENTRSIQLQAQEIIGLRQVNNDLTSQVSEQHSKANTRMWWIIILIAIIAAYLIIKAPKSWRTLI